MPRAIPLPLRQTICLRSQQGQDASTLARHLHWAARTVRRLLQQARLQSRDPSAAGYARCGCRPTPTLAPFGHEAVALRQREPRWGAGLIRVVLQRRHPQNPWPCTRTLERRFRQEGLMPTPAGRPSRERQRRAQAPHEVWQMDAADPVALQNGQRLCWLRLVDECSGAVLRTEVFPPGELGPGPAQCGPGRVAWGVRPGGMPLRFRVDNGTPWGSSSDLPPELALWLIGLGIERLWNRPRRPQDNGVVERSQGTGKRWAVPRRCGSAEEVQQRLQELDAIQREDYPSRDGRSRTEGYPQLAPSGRRYSPEGEESLWSLERVLTHLAGDAVPRRVDSSGKVSLYKRNYYVGALHKGKEVYVQFDPQQREWLFADSEGRQWRRQAAPEISRENLIGLRVTHRD